MECVNGPVKAEFLDLGLIRRLVAFTVGCLLLALIACSSADAGPVPVEGDALPSALAVTIGETTVRLIAVVPSASQTIIHMRIENPQIRLRGAGPPPILPLRDDELSLVNFVANEIQDRGVKERESGLDLRFVLPPLVDLNSPSALELKQFRLRNPVSGRYDLISGPWRFEFTLSVTLEQRASKKFLVNQEKTVGELTLRLTEVHASFTETRVQYELLGSETTAIEFLGKPRLGYDGQVVEGSNLPGDVTGSRSVSFPPIPSGTQSITVLFPQFLSSTGVGATVTISLPTEIKDTSRTLIPLNQNIAVAGRILSFTSLRLNGTGFEISYIPADSASSDLELAGPGALIQVSDDLGGVYVMLSSVTDVEKGPTLSVREQSIKFGGPLNRQASQLIISTTKTSLFSSRGFEFNIPMP